MKKVLLEIFKWVWMPIVIGIIALCFYYHMEPMLLITKWIFKTILCGALLFSIGYVSKITYGFISEWLNDVNDRRKRK